MSDDYLEPTTQSSAEFAVVIPAFNAEATLLASIESAHNAGASEVIVVDDGSTDSTAALCRAHDIRVLTQPNAGAYLARRRGATLVTAPYIVFLDADDLLVAPGIHESLRILSAQADCAVVAGRVMASLPRGRSRLNNQSYSEINTRTLLTQGYGPFPPGAALVRRADYEAAIALDVPEIVERYADDYEMFIVYPSSAESFNTTLFPSCIRCTQVNRLVLLRNRCCARSRSGGTTRDIWGSQFG